MLIVAPSEIEFKLVHSFLQVKFKVVVSLKQSHSLRIDCLIELELVKCVNRERQLRSG